MIKIQNLGMLCMLLILFTACSSTNRLTMKADIPPAVVLPQGVSKVAILDRSQASEKNAGIDRMDQILSAEGLHLDRKGATAAMNGLYDELISDPRLEEVSILEDLDIGRGGLGVFPAALPWSQVDAICKERGIDALFVLEFYDTDTRASFELTTMHLPNNLGIRAKVPAHKVTLHTQIKLGWRIYDPGMRIILDEFASRSQLSSTGAGINPVKAIEAVIDRNEGVISRSSFLGNSYGYRLRPQSIRVARDYYVKGTDNFVIGKRKAQTGDWDGAARHWENELGHRSPKIAGRACYNMAIISEINGNLDEALEWASRSYADYGNKNALRYVNIIKHRQAEVAALEAHPTR